MRETATSRSDLGWRGEVAAARFLESKGLHIVERRFRRQTGEIDLICKAKSSDGLLEQLIIVEVKTRRAGTGHRPEAAVSRAKRWKIANTTVVYLYENPELNVDVRFDVVSVIEHSTGFDIRHFCNAFGHADLHGEFGLSPPNTSLSRR